MSQDTNTPVTRKWPYQKPNPWPWRHLTVREFVRPPPGYSGPYLGRCTVTTRPFIIRDVTMVKTDRGIVAALPATPVIKNGQLVIDETTGKMERQRLLWVIDPDDMIRFSKLVVARIEERWGPLLRNENAQHHKVSPAVAECEAMLPDRYLP
jgi:hypothetical protein